MDVLFSTRAAIDKHRREGESRAATVERLASDRDALIVALRDMVQGCQYGEYDGPARDRARALLQRVAS